VEIGANYHHLDFSQKVRFAYDDMCATSHAQFWISKVPRALDPFFFPITNISRLCDEAQHILYTNNNQSHEAVKEAFVHNNTARAEVGRAIDSLNDIIYAVHLMSETPDRRRLDAGWHSGLQSRESMLCIPKALAWLHRMEDWQDDALDALRKLLDKEKEKARKK
jgi:hypothetical protein